MQFLAKMLFCKLILHLMRGRGVDKHGFTVQELKFHSGSGKIINLKIDHTNASLPHGVALGKHNLSMHPHTARGVDRWQEWYFFADLDISFNT